MGRRWPKFRSRLIGLGANSSPADARAPDANGVVNFGLVRPGRYRYRITRSLGTGSRRFGQLNVQPGSEVHESIVCPKVLPDRAAVLIKCDWPADLESERLVLYAPFGFRNLTLQPGVRWEIYDADFDVATEQRNPETPKLRDSRLDRATRSVLCGPEKTLTEILHLRGLVIWTVFQNGDMDDMAAAAKLGPGDWADVLEQDLRIVKDQTEAMKWEAGMYGLNELIVLRPTQLPDVEVGRRRFDILVACRTPELGRAMKLSSGPPTKDDLEILYGTMTGPMAHRHIDGFRSDGFFPTSPTLKLPAKYWRECPGKL